MVVLDTNIIIDHIRQSFEKDTIFQSLIKTTQEGSIAISLITIQELYEGKSTRDKEAEAYILKTISGLQIFPYTFEVAKKAGEIARDLGRSIELPNAAIAATAILNEASLLTLNQKDFKDIKGLDLTKV
ncbi:MAG TPA: type II toxin-antitoxin system VapC family toxin [Candidatus Paceibacterota bacterium]